MSNFAFLKTEWPTLHESAARSEQQVHRDPRVACFYARLTLEQAVEWLYSHDPAFERPYDSNLAALLGARDFRRHVPPAVQAKAHAIRKLGNVAAHEPGPVRASLAMQAVTDLYHLLYWLGRTYTGHDPQALPDTFDPALIPPAPAAVEQTSAEKLKRFAQGLVEQRATIEAQAEQIADYEAKLAALQAHHAKQAQIEAQKIANSAIPDSHDYDEAQTRRFLIDMLLREAGWEPQGENVAEYPLVGLPTASGRGRADYVLWGADGLPLAVIEAKRTRAAVERGRQQAALYADALEGMHGQRPIIFYTNGYDIYLWDDERYPPRRVQGFYNRDELALMIQRRTSLKPLAGATINQEIVNRYYQEAAIRHITEHFEGGHRKGLLVMATGTGKTRTAIALCDLLMGANWVKRMLFLADRTALVRQAVKTFNKYLPAANPVNLIEEKEAAENRVVVSTYQTMIGLIDEAEAGGKRLFGVGHFDLVIIDEAHRSVYRKFGAIFAYFDSLLLGLTATPKDEVDRNTYDLFGLEAGVPNYAYDLDQAVADGFLVPPVPMSVPLKFQREGIRYADLSAEEQAEWDLIEWSEDGAIPDEIEASALNKWLFNRDTIDKMLQSLMENGLTVKGGDRLGKTIIFARNHRHAEIIQARFDANYPHYNGKFAQVIDNYQSDPYDLIQKFSKADGLPHIAISVDMLDTGIDIHEVVNLVFFKLIRSKTKFFQMLGRGTRLCPDLFGPGQHKACFYVFDYCQNFEFFDLNPKGVETKAVEPLSQRIFKTRLEILWHLLDRQDDPALAALADTLRDQLHALVRAMPLDNFIVRPQRQYVDPFLDRARWDRLDRADIAALSTHVSGLPTQLPEEEERIKRFDLLLLELQLSILEEAPVFTRLRDRLIETAGKVAAKQTIPTVKAQLPLLRELQEEPFWAAVELPRLETVRQQLRSLAQYIDRRTQTVLYTNFADELGEIREARLSYITGGVNVAQYRKKVERFIRQHEDYVIIEKIKQAIPLTAEDVRQLEAFFFAAEGAGSREAFEQAYGPQENLGGFIRRLIGLDRKAAKAKFAHYLEGKTCTADQIQFINFIIDHLTQNGTVEPAILYERPFTDLHALGVDGLFPPAEADEIITILEAINGAVQPPAA